MYFALTDRFYDGDSENNIPPGSDPALYDKAQTNVNLYHGGDLRGLEIALQNGYFEKLGVTALWTTPPVRNVWYSGSDLGGPKTGYHGYWAQDFLDIDPHLVSRRSLDGSHEYADSRDGRMQHYKDFVALAHSRGIKVIQDIVLNHAGPVFFYDVNGNGRFDVDQKAEWEQPFKASGHYENAVWAETPKWDQHRTAPGEALTVLGREVKVTGALADLESYGRKGMSPGSLGKSDGEEIECDFFSLRDFWTKPGSANFDRLVNDFVEVYAFYLEVVGVDGFRIDTIKHAHHEFWDAFTERLRKRVGAERAKSLFLFGETYDGNPAKLGEYTYRVDAPAPNEPCLDSVLDFNFMYAARSYLRVNGKPFGAAEDIGKTMRARLPVAPAGRSRPFYNPAPGADGLSAARKLVNFIENHDGLNRFRVHEISERRNLLANALLLTVPGIPCLYYGTEAALEDSRGKIGADTESGRLTFIHAGDSPRFEAMAKLSSFGSIAALTRLRREIPALTSADFEPLSPDQGNGIFAYMRGAEGSDPLLVIINASNSEQVIGKGMKLNSAGGKPLFAAGEKLEAIPIAGLSAGAPISIGGTNDSPAFEIRVAPESVNLYRRTR